MLQSLGAAAFVFASFLGYQVVSGYPNGVVTCACTSATPSHGSNNDALGFAVTAPPRFQAGSSSGVQSE